MKYSLRHKSTGSVYPYIVPSGHMMIRGFFKRVYVNNRHRVPTDKPVLLAANHPTAFIDPCLLCIYLDAPLYNMTRGDIFKKPFYRNLLESINMFPVFRARDGYSQRDRNNEVFRFCMDKLKEQQVVTIYVEGEHHLEKRVRPAQKGIAMLTFKALEEEGLDDLQLIPAGCNYRYGDVPRDIAVVNIGAPIPLEPFRALYREDPNQANLQLRQAIEVALKEVCYHVEDEEDEPAADLLIEMHESDKAHWQLPFARFNTDYFEGEKKMLDRLNEMSGEEKDQVKEKLKSYFGQLRQAGVDDFSVVNAPKGHWLWAIYYLMAFPLFLIGYIFAWPVLAMARYVTNKAVRKKEFKTSVWMGVGHLFGMAYYFLLFLISLFTLNPFWIAFALALPLLGWYNMLYREHFQRWWGMRKALGLKDRPSLLAQRQEIKQHFQEKAVTQPVT